MWRFDGQVCINYLVARCRKHCWSTQCLSPKYLRGAENYRDFQHIFFSKINQKLRDVFVNMREFGKEGKMRNSLHDCGMVDTYALLMTKPSCRHYLPCLAQPVQRDPIRKTYSATTHHRHGNALQPRQATTTSKRHAQHRPGPNGANYG